MKNKITQDQLRRGVPPKGITATNAIAQMIDKISLKLGRHLNRLVTLHNDNQTIE